MEGFTFITHIFLKVIKGQSPLEEEGVEIVASQYLPRTNLTFVLLLTDYMFIVGHLSFLIILVVSTIQLSQNCLKDQFSLNSILHLDGFLWHLVLTK